MRQNVSACCRKSAALRYCQCANPTQPGHQSGSVFAIFRKVERLWIVFGRELNNFLRADLIAPEFFDGSYFNVLKEVRLGHFITRIADSWFGVQLDSVPAGENTLRKPVRQRKLKPTL